MLNLDNNLRVYVVKYLITLIDTYPSMNKLLAANRSEIAVRIFRSATEMGCRTVAIYAKEDRLGVHRFKADESYLVGTGKGPVADYLDIDSIIDLAKDKAEVLLRKHNGNVQDALTAYVRGQ